MYWVIPFCIGNTAAFILCWYYRNRIRNAIIIASSINWWGMCKGYIKHIFRRKIEKWLDVPSISHSPTHTTITYQDGSKEYKVRWKRKTSPSFIHKITDDKGNDITQDVAPYLGPDHDCHGIALTPKDIGHKAVTVHYLIPHLQEEFSSHELIVIK